jgi:hypothetical protein
VAPIRGFVEITVGIVPVVKVHAKLLASGSPTGSWAPVVIVAVYSVLAARSAFGVNIAVVPEYVTTPATDVPPGPVTVNVASSIVVAFIASLNVAVTTCATGTLVAPFAGAVAMTAGPRTGACSRPHPDIRPVSKNPRIQIIRAVTLRISFSYSIGGRALPCGSIGTPRRRLE